MWSAIHPAKFSIWILELIPLLSGLILLVVVYRRFRLTMLAYLLIWCAAVIITIGGHYTYDKVPLFNWLKDTWHLSRNYYDRLGHFVDGAVTTIIVRELLLRKTYLTRGKLLVLLIVVINLGISAGYELIEWGVGQLFTNLSADFLGTQGDIWDAQWDMLLAVCGSVCCLLALSKIHNLCLTREIGLLK